MSFFQKLKNRTNQRKAESFIKKIENKEENEVKQAFLDNKDFHNNEIVLRYLFFNYVGLISMLPIDFQKIMINSNLSFFKYASMEAKRSLVSDWLKNNKFFMNEKNLNLDSEEYENYICMYFNQVEDVAKLFMNDLYKVVDILAKKDLKRTESLIDSIKDTLTDKQWDFILKVNPVFIKYANENVQNKYSEDEAFSLYLSGSARDKYIKKQFEKIKENTALLNEMPIDIQREYIISNPYAINIISDEVLVDLLKYDIELIKYIDLTVFNKKEIIYDILENTANKNIAEIIDIFVKKCLLNAKGKLYRFDINSGNVYYQYTKRLIKIIQSLSINQIIALINIDINYSLAYIVPCYSDKDDGSVKINEALEANSRCLNLFKAYYGNTIYDKYYTIINKIYNEFISNIEKYNYSTDYNSIFDLFKVLFNKNIVEKNSVKRINIFIGTSLLYKKNGDDTYNNAASELLNEFLSNAYHKVVKIWKDIYNINSLELFDNRLSFLSNDIIAELSKLNGVNMSLLLYIIKSNEYRKSFINYYEILTSIYDDKIIALMHALDNYMYYHNILSDIEGKNLNDKELENLLRLILSKNNYLNVTKKEELLSYDIDALKKLISDFSSNNIERLHKNIFSNYFFNKSYDENEYVANTKIWCDICDSNLLKELGNFTDEEINLFITMKLLFSVDNSELLLSFIEEYVSKKININYVSIINFFSKLDKNKYNIINKQIVNINDIENLYEVNNQAVSKRVEEGVVIYEFFNQDFKILSSYTNDGYHYGLNLISQTDRNCYGYNYIPETIPIRFSLFGDIVLVKTTKGRINEMKLTPDFIFVKDKITPDILKTAKENNLAVVTIGGGTYE